MKHPRVVSAFLIAALAGMASAQTHPETAKVPRSIEQLVVEARVAVPPVHPSAARPADLVDLANLDSTLRFDIRYASSANFLHTRIYPAARAFLQRPAAEALVRVNRALHSEGYALLVYDAYRPWWVTKVFWEATAPGDRSFVADPAKGSVHNRGCAVDLTLVRHPGGSLVAMPSEYDEMSPRSHPDYPGGTVEARCHRDLLRAAMEKEGFRVEPSEWWHFDHASSAEYPILNLPFDAILGQPPILAQAGQVLLVTTTGWEASRGQLQRFERRGGVFVPVGGPLEAWVGKNGMAWRSDEAAPMPPTVGPVKREGDGRAPAGLMSFGTLWGYAPRAPEGVRLPYRPSTDCDRCVDDPDHAEYGRLVRLGSPTEGATWRSAERLRLDSEHYRYLVVIHYNDLHPRKGAGSCIFLHVAPPPGQGTAGCTALAADDLLHVLRWMDPAQHPVLLQFPETQMDAIRAAWSLPGELHPTGQ